MRCKVRRWKTGCAHRINYLRIRIVHSDDRGLVYESYKAKQMQLALSITTEAKPVAALSRRIFDVQDVHRG